MSYTNGLDKPSDYFNTVLYTGNGTSQSITGVGFQPDWLWLKILNATGNHVVYDVIRGTSARLRPSSNSAEDTNSITSFDSDGFTLSAGQNTNTFNYIAWNWLASNTTASNTDGSITSTVSANTTAGFSIVSWTGSGASATVGHGLSSAPQLVIVKNRTDSATDWRIGNTVVSGNTMSDGNGYYLEFDTGAIANPGSATIWGSPATAPTSTVFSVGSNNSNNGSSDNMIAYCFHSVKGYSKMGTYTGNGNANGTFVYTGFKPAYVMAKNTTTGHNWWVVDNKRDTFNAMYKLLRPNTSGAETGTAGNENVDFYSNGFKLRETGSDRNESGATHIYMAFAENPFVTSTGVPTCAR